MEGIVCGGGGIKRGNWRGCGRLFVARACWKKKLCVKSAPKLRRMGSKYVSPSCQCQAFGRMEGKFSICLAAIQKPPSWRPCSPPALYLHHKGRVPPTGKCEAGRAIFARPPPSRDWWVGAAGRTVTLLSQARRSQEASVKTSLTRCGMPLVAYGPPCPEPLLGASSAKARRQAALQGESRRGCLRASHSPGGFIVLFGARQGVERPLRAKIGGADFFW